MVIQGEPGAVIRGKKVNTVFHESSFASILIYFDSLCSVMIYGMF